MTDFIEAWQCIGCGKIEAPATCIGVCRDRRILMVGKHEHERALAEIERLQGRLANVRSALLRFRHSTPRDGQWERSYRALQDQVSALLIALGETDSAAA
jgi:hypothetical protein